MNERHQKKLYLIYDGDCILCRNTALAVRIKNALGNLETINARSNHPLVTEVLTQGYDLNEGIVVKYNDQLYHGADAMNFLALISSKSNFFNKLNAVIFKRKKLAHVVYPIFKTFRNLLLKLRGFEPIRPPKQKPLIEKIFTESHESISKILKQRYSNKAFDAHTLKMEGHLNISLSPMFHFLSPLFRLTGALVPFPGKNIRTTVEMISTHNSRIIIMKRTLYYPNKKPFTFISRVEHVNNNTLVERMRFGLSARLYYFYEKNSIFLKYGGYILKLGKVSIRLPLGFLFGRFSGEEKALDDNHFEMTFLLHHFLMGKLFQYSGIFKIIADHSNTKQA